LNYRTFVL